MGMWSAVKVSLVLTTGALVVAEDLLRRMWADKSRRPTNLLMESMTFVKLMKPTELGVVLLVLNFFVDDAKEILVELIVVDTGRLVVVAIKVVIAFWVVTDGDILLVAVGVDVNDAVVWARIVNGMSFVDVIKEVDASIEGEEDISVKVVAWAVVCVLSLWGITGIIDEVNAVIVVGSGEVVETVTNKVVGVDVINSKSFVVDDIKVVEDATDVSSVFVWNLLVSVVIGFVVNITVEVVEVVGRSVVDDDETIVAFSVKVVVDDVTATEVWEDAEDNPSTVGLEEDKRTVEGVDNSDDARPSVDLLAVMDVTIVFAGCVDSWLGVVGMDSVIKTAGRLVRVVVSAIAHVDVCICFIGKWSSAVGNWNAKSIRVIFI
jgi:hypothetical protein